jgi:hypothetical protein
MMLIKSSADPSNKIFSGVNDIVDDSNSNKNKKTPSSLAAVWMSIKTGSTGQWHNNLRKDDSRLFTKKLNLCNGAADREAVMFQTGGEWEANSQ